MHSAGQVHDARSWLKVCVTCDRLTHPPTDAPSLGERLAQALEVGLRERFSGAVLDLRRVPCLSGCLHPGNIAVGASGRYKLRLHGLGPAHVDPILDLAEACTVSFNGYPAPAAWPELLKGRLATIVPPPASGRSDTVNIWSRR